MNIPTWEYKLEQARAGPRLNLQKIIDSFNELGRMGWEAVAAIVGSRGQVFVLFKRRGPDIFHDAAREVSTEIRPLRFQPSNRTCHALWSSSTNRA
jgi:hypothetical protein